MFVQLAACSFGCGQGGCRDVCATCSLQFWLRAGRVPRCLCNLQLAVLISDSEGAEMFVQLAACSFDCGCLRTLIVPICLCNLQFAVSIAGVYGQ